MLRIKLAFLGIGVMFASCATADVCSDIAQIYRASQTGFASWKGAYDKDLEEYSSTYLLPNAIECIIELDGGTRDFSCRWELRGEQEMRQAYDALTADIRKCSLGGETPRQKSREFPEKESARIVVRERHWTYFEYPERESKVDVNRGVIYSKRRGTTAYEVNFIFQNWK